MTSRYWLVRKVACLVGYYGGFRSIELKSLKFENCESDEMGYWFCFTWSKQRSLVEESSICVPRRLPDWESCVQDASRRPIDYDPASLIDLYFEQLMLDFGCQKEDLKGTFFKGCHGKEGKRFTNVNVGKNTLGYFGVKIASELLLPFPETFTGHCWRRSAGTNASNAGVNVTTLMSIMGWRCPKTAMEYVKRSRITSLKMSMYLTNVQRQNCAVPFPSKASDRHRKTLFPALKDSSKGKKQIPFSFTQEEVGEETELFSQDFKNLRQKDISLKSENTQCEKVVSNSLAFPSDSNLSAIAESRDNKVDREESLPTAIVVEPEPIRDTVVPTDIDHSIVDSRLSNILQNMHNHGNVHIHFHFDKK